MRKKWYAILFLSLCMISFAACGSTQQESDDQKEVSAAQAEHAQNVQKPQENAEEAEADIPQEPGMVEDMEITLHLRFGDRTGTYTGEMENGLPNGKGKFTTKNEEGGTWYYEGDFVDGRFEGEGKTVWETGQLQEGTYRQDNWIPTFYQFLLQKEAIGKVNLTNTSKEFIKEHLDLFPAESKDMMSAYINEAAEYRKMEKNVGQYGNSIIKIPDMYVTYIDAGIANPDEEEAYQIEYNYVIMIDEFGSVYQGYYFGDMEDVYNEDKIGMIYAVPISSGGFDNAGGGYTHTIDLAICYFEK